MQLGFCPLSSSGVVEFAVDFFHRILLDVGHPQLVHCSHCCYLAARSDQSLPEDTWNCPLRYFLLSCCCFVDMGLIEQVDISLQMVQLLEDASSEPQFLKDEPKVLLCGW